MYGGLGHTPLAITKASNAMIIKVLAGVAIGSLLIGQLLRLTDSSYIVLDATTTAMSLIAQWMMSKKWLQHWWLWMVMNAISLMMYSSKGLYITCTLYAIYFALCIMGYYQWRAELQQNTIRVNEPIVN
jgi:nicotinamide mononucleotide transporter